MSVKACKRMTMEVDIFTFDATSQLLFLRIHKHAQRLVQRYHDTTSCSYRLENNAQTKLLDGLSALAWASSANIYPRQLRFEVPSCSNAQHGIDRCCVRPAMVIPFPMWRRMAIIDRRRHDIRCACFQCRHRWAIIWARPASSSSR